MEKKNVILGVLAVASILAIGMAKRVKDEIKRRESIIDITDTRKEK